MHQVKKGWIYPGQQAVKFDIAPENYEFDIQVSVVGGWQCTGSGFVRSSSNRAINIAPMHASPASGTDGCEVGTAAVHPLTAAGNCHS